MNRVLAAGEANLTPKRTAVVHAWVTADIAEFLRIEADRRGTHPDRLAADLITIIVGDDVMGAVLDR